jgi:hypothetical protein
VLRKHGSRKPGNYRKPGDLENTVVESLELSKCLESTVVENPVIINTGKLDTGGLAMKTQRVESPVKPRR